MMEERETIFEKNKIIKNINIQIKNNLQSVISANEAAVRTPFPPLNPKKHGYICPTMQAKPVKYILVCMAIKFGELTPDIK